MQHQPGTALVVDDSVLTCRVVSDAVERFGFRAIQCHSAPEALQFLARSALEIELVISDIVMADMDGFELMEKVHTLYPDLPVVLMTAHADVDLVVRAIKQHALDLMVKPVEDRQLELTLQTVISRRDLVAAERGLLDTLRRTVEEQNAELQRKMVALEENRALQAAEHEALKGLFRQVQDIKEEWERTMDCVADMVLLIDSSGKLRRCNRALRHFTGQTYSEILGSYCRALFARHQLTSAIGFVSGAELHHAPTDRWFVYREAPFASGKGGSGGGTVITIHDTTQLKLAVSAREAAYQQLQETQAQVVQSEKLATIGQLTAGVAHEINNPIGFVSSNLVTMRKYSERLSTFLAAQTDVVNRAAPSRAKEELTELRRSLKIDRILHDVDGLITESLDGTGRVSKIVKDLGAFSRLDSGDWQMADVTECVERAVTIVWNQIRYKATLRRDYGEIPQVHCNPQQLNQVVMNLLVNASHAIEKDGEIVLTTRAEPGSIRLSVSDTGAGIPAQNLTKIFEPFFTTKEAGKGTGLGLSISYDIVKKHGGELTVESTLGVGTTFTLRLPAH